MQYFESGSTDIDANLHQCSMRQGNKTVDFGGHGVNGQGRTRPKYVTKIPFDELSQALCDKI